MSATVQGAILLFGDSITQGGWQSGGFVAQLAHAYVRRLDVINRGLGGYNTEWGIPVLEQCLAPQHEQTRFPKIRILTIWFGANDACLPPSRQHVPLDKYRANLEHMINMVHSPTSEFYSPDTQVILITPPPINLEQRKENCPGNPVSATERQNEVTTRYTQVVREVGEQLKIPVADIAKALWDAASGEEAALKPYLSDGLHFTVEGYNLVYKTVMQTINTCVPMLRPEKLREVFLPWDEVDVTDPRRTLRKRKIDG